MGGITRVAPVGLALIGVYVVAGELDGNRAPTRHLSELHRRNSRLHRRRSNASPALESLPSLHKSSWSEAEGEADARSGHRELGFHVRAVIV